MASNNSPDWYPQFLQWWTANVKTPQDAAYGRAYYEQRLAQDKQNEQDKKAEKAQRTSDITGAGMALGVPLAYAGGKALFDNLGSTAAAATPQALGNAASAAAPSLMQTAATSGAPQLINAASAGQSLASPTLLGANRIGGAAPAVAAEGGGFLSSALPIAGGALGAYGMYDLLSGDNVSAGRGALQGAGSGAAIGALGGPWGAAIGAGVGGLLGLGKSMFGSKERFKEEWKRKKKLVEAGILPPEALGEQLERGRSTDELYDIEMKKQQAGQYANPIFAKSRDVKDLTPFDIWGYSEPYETLGRSYTDSSPEQRYEFNRQMLEKGLVDEGRGQINYKDPTQAKSIWDQVLSGGNLPALPSYQDAMNKIGTFVGGSSPVKTPSLPSAPAGNKMAGLDLSSLDITKAPATPMPVADMATLPTGQKAFTPQPPGQEDLRSQIARQIFMRR